VPQEETACISPRSSLSEPGYPLGSIAVRSHNELRIDPSFLRPIEALLLDEDVSEIMGNPDSSWSCERDGRLCQERNISSTPTSCAPASKS